MAVVERVLEKQVSTVPGGYCLQLVREEEAEAEDGVCLTPGWSGKTTPGRARAEEEGPARGDEKK